MPTPTYTPISKTVLSSSQSLITISGIPQSYTDLLVVTVLRSTYPGVATNWVTIRFNGTSSSLYSGTYMMGFSTSTQSGRFTTSTSSRIYPYYIDADNNTANVWGSGEFYIPNYTSSTTKVISATGVAESNTTTDNVIVASANLFANTSGITSIEFNPNGGTFDSGCRVDLYGISNA